MRDGLWPQPQRRDVGVFSDLSLYVDALELAQHHGGITATLLQKELGPRLRAFRLVRQQSASVTRSLVAELQLFGWLGPFEVSPQRRACIPVQLTADGHEALKQARADPRAFLRSLAERMHAVYVIPGWFVSRLWAINPSQGEVILPAPGADWSPSPATREARSWTSELRDHTLAASALARAANPLAFPVEDVAWHAAVRAAWERLRDRKMRLVVSGLDPVTSSRSGLTLAMRMASLTILFGRTPVGNGEPDFPAERPVTPKTFKSWCPRLQALELIGYTDWHPHVNGRLLFPTAVFRARGEPDQFEELPGIRHPDGRPLFLHQPAWDGARKRFWQTLVEVYGETFRRVQSRYLSLPDVRDEVCRRLRLSPTRFELFLEHASQEGPEEGGWHLSLETDMREDLRTGRGLTRRPVYVRAVPHTLIALARLPRIPRSTS
jgi:hypothetical protein